MISSRLRRNSLRRVTRRNLRSPIRYGTRLQHGARHHWFKELSLSLTAFNRALKSHRRLTKLAPAFFDPAVVDHMRKEREKSLARQRIWEPILNKVYGVTSTTLTPNTQWDPVLPKSRQKRRTVDHELLQCELWLKIGHHHLARFQQTRPHAVIRLTDCARLLEVGLSLKRLACGLTTTQPPGEPEVTGWLTGDEALRKIYGKPLDIETSNEP